MPTPLVRDCSPSPLNDQPQAAQALLLGPWESPSFRGLAGGGSSPINLSPPCAREAPGACIELAGTALRQCGALHTAGCNGGVSHAKEICQVCRSLIWCHKERGGERRDGVGRQGLQSLSTWIHTHTHIDKCVCIYIYMCRCTHTCGVYQTLLSIPAACVGQKQSFAVLRAGQLTFTSSSKQEKSGECRRGGQRTARRMGSSELPSSFPRFPSRRCLGGVGPGCFPVKHEGSPLDPQLLALRARETGKAGWSGGKQD